MPQPLLQVKVTGLGVNSRYLEIIIILPIAGEKSVEHTSSQVPAKTDSPASANDEGRNLIHIKLPETLVDSCLVCTLSKY